MSTSRISRKTSPYTANSRCTYDTVKVNLPRQVLEMIPEVMIRRRSSQYLEKKGKDIITFIIHKCIEFVQLTGIVSVSKVGIWAGI